MPYLHITVAELGGAVANGSKCAFGLVPELDIVREKRILGVFGQSRLLLRDNIHRR
jgi:hypothetical protein